MENLIPPLGYRSRYPAKTKHTVSMHVKTLDFTIYGPTGQGWESHKVLNPCWDDIENAIVRLDQFEHPFLHMWASPDENQHNYDDSDVLEIMGGDGAWWLAGTFDGYFQRRLDYPDNGEDEIVVGEATRGLRTGLGTLLKTLM